MEQINIRIWNKENEIIADAQGEKEVALVYKKAYQEGDSIQIEVEEKNTFYWIQIDDSMGKSMVYLIGDMQYHIPFGEHKLNLSPKAFEGERHLISVKKAKEFEYRCYRNLSFNVNDQHGQFNSFPHASANVETRGEEVFAAMNAIDGVIVPQGHGQEFLFEKKKIEWLEFSDLKKADDPSPFPALTQFEVYGMEC